MPDLDLRPGTLLVAPPSLLEPNFRRSVVLLCDHNAEGSFGLVINRPLDAALSDVIDGFDEYDGILSLGGPVQTDTLHYLHRHPLEISDAIPVLDGVLWGGRFESIRDLIHSADSSPRTLRFFLGYAGWGSGQLEAEVDQGGWVITEARSNDVFSEAPDALWRNVLRRMGGEYAILSNFPEDPRMN